MILIDKLHCNRGESRAEFERKLRSICDLLRINPNWLMMLMFLESGLNAQAVNKQDGDSSDPYTRAAKRATGLSQFMPDTARSMGTTTQQLYKMSAIEQLDYVYRYFKGYTGRIKSYYDLYLINFFPIAIGKPDNWVFQTTGSSASIIAKQNPGMDINKDGKVTVGEAKQRMRDGIPKEFFEQVISVAQKKSFN
jgi:hypothetical protein